MPNDFNNLISTFEFIPDDNYLFEGWAKELHNLKSAWNHKDIDLLYVANDFNKIDYFINNNNLKEIKAK